MNVKSCRKCKRLFNYVVGPMLCQSCRDEEESKFQTVKKYVQEHMHSGIQEVSEECEVSVAQIKQWLREERLVLTDESPMGIGCERCGKMIKSGKYCEECKAELANTFQNAMGKKGVYMPPKQDNRSGARMRFMDHK